MFKQFGTYLLNMTQPHLYRDIIRSKSLGKKIARKKRTTNPGIDLQVKALREGPEDVFDLDIIETEELESDFMNVQCTHKEHVEQLNKLREKEKLLIIKQKYFKETLPNFLTWNDKQQIQYLHKTNPEEWTIEALSEGFPALPETINKIVKATWTKNSSKIMNHDNSVKNNWELFKRGKLELPPNLINHLNKFTNRSPTHYENEIVPDNKQVNNTNTSLVTGEFSEIIKSYERLKNKTEPVVDKILQLPEAAETRKVKKEMYLATKNVSQRNNITLQHLRTSLEVDVNLGKTIDEDSKILLKQLSDTKEIENTIIENSIIDLKDISKTAYLSASNTTRKDDKHLQYPERIVIPDNKLTKGCTYKLYDCYYDSDGLFLYRVPGMEK